MFFDFCTRTDYPERYWPAVWDVEVAIQAVIMEKEDAVFNLSADVLKSEVVALLEIMGKASEIESLSGKGWIVELLDFELPHVVGWLNENRSLLGGHKPSRILLPNSKLMECLKYSDGFVRHIKSSAESYSKPSGK